jgi:hypothetical protein
MVTMEMVTAASAARLTVRIRERRTHNSYIFLDAYRVS